MKKTLLSLLSLATCASLGAATFHLGQPAPIVRATGDFGGVVLAGPQDNTDNAPAKAPEKASGSMNYTLAGEPYSATTFNNIQAGNQVSMAMCLAPDVTTTFAGNQISHINFYCGVNAQTNRNQLSTYYVFISTDLTAEPIYTQRVTTKPTAFSYISAALETPYTIEAGTEVYVGCYTTLKNDYDYVLVFDNIVTSKTDGAWAGYRAGAEGSFTWLNAASQLGSMCVGCTISGDNLPENMASVDDIAVNPYANAGTPFQIDFLFTNQGANDINNITYTYQIGNDAAKEVEYTLPSALSPSSNAVLSITDAIGTGSSLDPQAITVTVTKVNGEENKQSDKAVQSEIILLPEGKGYTRNILMEEATSTKCGYCPVGFVGMEYAREKYNDGSCAIVSIHSKFGGKADPMEIPSYANYLSDYVTSFPSSTFNRLVEVYPADAYIDEYYPLVHALPSPAEFDLMCDWTDETKTSVKFTTKSRSVFDFQGNAPLRLCYVITEDNVGPYQQTNYFSGGGEGPMGGWENKGSNALTRYNDVARLLETYNGIPGSFPANMEADKDYEFVHDVKLPSIVKSADNITAVCFILNTKSGVVENVKYVRAADFGKNDSAIDDITADSTDAPVEYFDLQGRRVANPAAGLYIRRQGDKVEKVILR